METTYEFLLTTVTMSMFVAPILFRVVKHFEKEKTLAVSGNVVSIDSLKTEKPIVADLKPSAIIDQAA